MQYPNRDSSHPHSLVVGHFNNDNYVDIVVANTGFDSMTTYLGDGNNSFTTQITYSMDTGSVPRMVTVGHFNDDTQLDVVVANFGTNNLMVLFGNGDGYLSYGKKINTSSTRPLYVAVADFDKNGYSDIAFIGHGSDNIDILLGYGDGNFSKPIHLFAGYDSLPHSLAVGDINSDNELDLVVANYGTDNVGLFLGYGNGSFSNQTTYTTGIHSRPYSIALSDLNNSTYMDVAVVNSNTDAIKVFFDYINGSFTASSLYPTGENSNPIFIAIADFNKDNKSDIAVLNNGTNSFKLFFGQRNNNFQDPLTYFTGARSSPYSLGIADFNNDNQLDVAIANQQTNNIKIFNSYTRQTFTLKNTLPTNSTSSSFVTSYLLTGSPSKPISINIGDFNSDSALDIVVANQNQNNLGVFLGYGNGKFSTQTVYSTGIDSSPTCVIVNDFNNDRRLDIAVANHGTHNIGIFLGYGNGEFASQKTYSTRADSSPISVATNDFNNDGRLDIVVANYRANNICIFLGHGDGQFFLHRTYSTDAYSRPYSLIAGDLNNDGRSDIAVCNSGTDNLGIFYGYGDGQFSSQETYVTGNNSNPQGIAVGDFNNDSRLDIAVANHGADNVGIFLGHGNGTLLPQNTIFTGINSCPKTVVIVDLNRDGRLDIVVANYDANNLGVFLGYGNGSFSSQMTYFTGNNSGSFSLVIGDFNNDEQLDIGFTMQKISNVGIFFGYGNGTFSRQMDSLSGASSIPASMSSGDFNKDGRVDIIVSNFGTNDVGIFLGYGNRQFSPLRTFSTGNDSMPISVVAADFSNDGCLDVAVANYGTNSLGILLGFGNGSFSSQKIYSTGNNSNPFSIATADFNRDGKLDIVVANTGIDSVGVFLGNGDGTFSSQDIHFTGTDSRPISVIAFDFNNDGGVDIAVANHGRGNIGVFLGYGTGRFTSQNTHLTGANSYPRSLAAGDFNNDHCRDIAVVNAGTSTVGIFLGYGDGDFSSQTIYSLHMNSKPISIVTDDLNNDGRLDIVVANADTDDVAVLLGYGNGKFAPCMVYPIETDANPYSITAGDFDGDDHVDIAVANTGKNYVSIFFGKGTGFFAFSLYSSTVLLFSMRIAVGYFNNDDQLDVAVANYAMDNIGILSGNGDGSLQIQSVFSTGYKSRPNAIVVADFDNDSRLDIAVANYGTNNIGVFLQYNKGEYSNLVSYSTGSGSMPRSLAVGDFNDDGQLDITVANSGTNRIGIFFGDEYGKFSGQVPFFIAADFQPISIAVADLNHDGHLDVAVVCYFPSNVGILFGGGEGVFEGIKIFSTGFFSYPGLLAIGDFDNDGHSDIAVGNTNNREEHVLILVGDGYGNFSTPRRYTSGVDFGLCSLVLGDLSNDSQLDMAIIHRHTKEIAIFLGHGDGTFSSKTSYSTDDYFQPETIAVGDFNNDNLTDIAFANFGTHIVGVFLALVETSFINNGTWFTGSAASPGAVALGDFNNDGQLDIVVGKDGTHNIDILLNNDHGNFLMNTVYRTDSTFYPTSLVAADFNSDNQLDIAVSDSIMNTVTFLYGEGNGTFRSSPTFSTGISSQPQSIATGDFNSDNRKDLVAAYSGTASVGLFLTIDNGALESPKLLPTGYDSKPHGITVADFDNDGHLDIAVANNGNKNIGFFFGVGNGTFSEQRTISLGTDIYAIWIDSGDFNNDDRLDLVVSSNVAPTPSAVLLADDYRSFRVQKIDSVNGTYKGAVEDFNNDGYLDVVFCQEYYDALAVLLGFGDGTFRDPIIYLTGAGSYPTSITANDFNLDGKLDIAVANNHQNSISILLGYGNGTFSSQSVYFLYNNGAPLSIISRDFNNDKWPDVAIGIQGQNSLGIFFGKGNGTFLPPFISLTGDGSIPQDINAGDFNKDGQLDIIIANTDSGNVGIILGHVYGSFFNEINYSTGNNSYPFSIGLGDFNNDGRLDVVVSNMLDDNIAVFLGYASENFVSTTTKRIGKLSEPVSIAVGDFNNDTCLDVVVADRGTNEIVVLQGTGYGTFSHQSAYSTGNSSSPSWITVEDFNQDQYLDIAVANSGTNNIAVFLGNMNGTFSSSIISSIGNAWTPVSLSVGYFNNDTLLDIAIANFGSNNVCLLFGHGNGSFTNPECRTSGYDSRPVAVASGDMNGDNKTDLVIANKGPSTIEILTEIC